MCDYTTHACMRSLAHTRYQCDDRGGQVGLHMGDIHENEIIVVHIKHEMHLGAPDRRDCCREIIACKQGPPCRVKRSHNQPCIHTKIRGDVDIETPRLVAELCRQIGCHFIQQLSRPVARASAQLHHRLWFTEHRGPNVPNSTRQF